MASFNDVRKNLLNDMADRNRIGGDEAGAGVWGAMADGKMTAANCDELAEEMKHPTGLTLQRKRAIKADALRDRAREQALLQSQRLKERQQRAAHHDFELSRQSNNLEALKNEYQVECAHPGGHASSVGTNFEVT